MGDLICVTEAGYQAHEFNAFINIKSALKRLQFNTDKCKTMIIGKKSEKYPNNDLFVDKWTMTYQGRGETETLTETYDGKVVMEPVTAHKYLGHYISSAQNNMAHLEKMKIKAVGIKNNILSMLDNMFLGRYYFECGVILMTSLLRSSILYSIETCFNLTEKEPRFV